MVANAVSQPETEETRGLRHMLEHLVVKGQDRLLDRRLEAKGLTLTATTTRDYMVIQITGPQEHLDDAIAGMKEITLPISVTQEEIDKEAKILAEELALRPFFAFLFDSAWSAGFGDKGISAFGDEAAWKIASPEILKAIHAQQFSAPNLTVAVVGRVNVEPTMRKLSEAFRGTPGSGPRRTITRAFLRDEPRGEAMVTGEAIGVSVGGLNDGGIVPQMAAGFALASRFPGLEVLYTPSFAPGMVVLATQDQGVTIQIERLPEVEKNALFREGLAIAGAWVSGLQNTPDRYARIKAIGMAGASGFDPAQLTRQLSQLTPSRFSAAMNRFSSVTATRVERR
jgi:hypothetical protein